MTPDISFINDNSALAKACLIWNEATVLALDTEFIRTDTFYPRPALLQVYDGRKCYLLDLVALSEFSALVAIFNNKLITKVLHSCSEDLEIFEGLLKTLPSPLFDTQIAAAFLGYGFSIGYSRLVKNLFDAEPPKDESRSNWLQRPLSQDQIEYAAKDVIYLYKIYMHFCQQLDDNEKKTWIEQSHREMLDNYRSNQQPEHYFQRIKSAWRLSEEEQRALYQFCLWREQEARRRNKPRNRISSDETLFEHAQHKTYPKGYVDSNQKPATHPIPEAPLPRETGELVKQLKSCVDKTAQSYNIAPEVLGRKKDLIALVNSGINGSHFQLPIAFTGWRKNIVGNELLTIANLWKDSHQVMPGTQPK